MAELLVNVLNIPHSNPSKIRREGHVVTIRPDGAGYGAMETWPRCFKVKLPMVPMTNPILCKLSESLPTKLRKGWLRYADLPQAAKDKIAATGEIIIKAHPNYNGPYDYTWTQVKNYFWDDESQTNIDTEI
jgi:hypothetical protein